ncbi:hypothetical protein ACUN90_28065, partial [Escherichia sp. SP-MK2]
MLIILITNKESSGGCPESTKCGSYSPIHFAKLLSMSIFSDYSSSSEMHNNLTIDYYLALSSTKGSGITNIISIILQQAQDYDVAKIAMSMISGKLGEDKQNKQEKSETAVR